MTYSISNIKDIFFAAWKTPISKNLPPNHFFHKCQNESKDGRPYHNLESFAYESVNYHLKCNKISKHMLYINLFYANWKQ